VNRAARRRGQRGRLGLRYGRGYPMNNEPEFLDTAQLARWLGRSVKFIHKHRRRMPGAVKQGGRWAYRKCEVEKRMLTGQLLLPAK